MPDYVSRNNAHYAASQTAWEKSQQDFSRSWRSRVDLDTFTVSDRTVNVGGSVTRGFIGAAGGGKMFPAQVTIDRAARTLRLTVWEDVGYSGARLSGGQTFRIDSKVAKRIIAALSDSIIAGQERLIAQVGQAAEHARQWRRRGGVLAE